MQTSEVQRIKALEKENKQLKELAGAQVLAIQTMKDELKKRGWDLSVERSLVLLMQGKGLSQRRACRALDAKRTSVRYQGRPESPLNVALRAELRALSQKHQRYGVPRMAAILHEEHGVNHKRVERPWKDEGLPLPRKLLNYRPSTLPWGSRPKGRGPTRSGAWISYIT